MVAKHGWKIMTKLKSLLAKIFKVRYFPHLSFFEANLALILVMCGEACGNIVMYLNFVVGGELAMNVKLR
jgi:thioredoxin-related protein